MKFQELHKQGSPDIIIGLAGNKCDLSSSRRVSKQEAEQYAEENGCVYMETSAKTGENIRELVIAMGILYSLGTILHIARMIPKEPGSSNDPETPQIDVSSNAPSNLYTGQSSGCCY